MKVNLFNFNVKWKQNLRVVESFKLPWINAVMLILSHKKKVYSRMTDEFAKKVEGNLNWVYMWVLTWKQILSLFPRQKKKLKDFFYFLTNPRLQGRSTLTIFCRLICNNKCSQKIRKACEFFLRATLCLVFRTI